MAASGKCRGCDKEYYLEKGKIPWHEKNRKECPGVGKKPK